MNLPPPIISLAGEPEVHERAKRYNDRLVEIGDVQEELSEALEWNDYERFGTGFFAHTKPPIPTAEIRQRIRKLKEGIDKEREEIVRLSGGTAKP